jgi:hypothetical protein
MFSELASSSPNQAVTIAASASWPHYRASMTMDEEQRAGGRPEGGLRPVPSNLASARGIGFAWSLAHTPCSSPSIPLCPISRTPVLFASSIAPVVKPSGATTQDSLAP